MRLETDLRSKLLDGVLSFVGMAAVMVALILMIKLFKLLGTASYGICCLLVLAGSAWGLARAIDDRPSEVARAWYGVVGGFCAWTVTELGNVLGFASIEDWDGSLLLVLALLVLTVLWRRLPLGARFWGAIFAMNWGGHVVIHVQRALYAPSPVPSAEIAPR